MSKVVFYQLKISYVESINKSYRGGGGNLGQKRENSLKGVKGDSSDDDDLYRYFIG